MWADQAYTGDLADWLEDTYGWELVVGRRPPGTQDGFARGSSRLQVGLADRCPAGRDKVDLADQVEPEPK